MTNEQLKQATELAVSKAELPKYNGWADGFGLPDFKPVFCTIPMLAEIIRWQCVMLNGAIDAESMAAIKYYGKHRFNVVGAI